MGETKLRPLKRLKDRLKNRVKALKHGYLRRLHAFDAEDLYRALRRVGLSDDATVMVHSSFDRFVGFKEPPSAVILTIRRAIGEGGTLLMPTMPFGGVAVEYARDLEYFDVRKSPSRMGLLTELFRRMPGVERSVHPTHPVAAWGPAARAMIEGHESSSTPCGRDSPFGHLLDHAGKVLLLGTGIEALTFFHCAEEMLEPRMSRSPFTDEVFHLNSRRGDGSMVKTHTRLYSPDMSRRRNLGILERRLREAGQWQETKIGHLGIDLLDASQIWNHLDRMADEGVFCYDHE